MLNTIIVFALLCCQVAAATQANQYAHVREDVYTLPENKESFSIDNEYQEKGGEIGSLFENKESFSIDNEYQEKGGGIGSLFDIDECKAQTANCDHMCVNTPGSFSCSCTNGYQLSSNGYSCNDIDECSTNNGQCSHTCINEPGSFHCSCRHGFRLNSDQQSCSNIDECSTNNGQCSHTCINEPGSFHCSCRHGFRLNSDQQSCSDIDECAESTSGCSQSCNNTDGGYKCSCKDGYTLSVDGTNCDDIDECSTNNGQCSHTCINEPGSFHCSCRHGFRLNSDQQSCSDIDECAESTSGCSQSCNNTDGGYKCSCKDGYTLSVDGTNCDDIDECSTNNGQCSHTCINEPGSFHCSCRHGFRLNSDQQSCSDIDECAESTSGCSQSCNNTDGGYKCSCKDGYTLSVDGTNCDDIDDCLGRVCQHDGTCLDKVKSFSCLCVTGYTGQFCESDIDECTAQTANCDHMCVNTPGSFSCSCTNGYQLSSNGYSCNDIDECSTNNGQCSHTCVNEPGSFHCSCRHGFRLNSDQQSCSDIDECAESTSGCSQSCNNTDGGYTCSCKDGYTLSVDGKNCDDIDDCLGRVCQHDGTCLDKVKSFSCLCVTGYTGQFCESDIDECDGHLKGGCEDVCTNTDGSYFCQCSGNKTLSGDGFTCNGGTTQPSVFVRRNIVRKLLPRGCYTFLLTRCSEGNDIKMFLSSTASWYQLRRNASITFTLGIVFVELDSLSLPVSITGMTILQTSIDFKINTGGLAYNPSDGIQLHERRNRDCWTFDVTPRDIHDFLSSNSFLHSFYEGINDILPNWLKFSSTGTTLFDISGLHSEFVHGREIQEDNWCGGAPVFDDHMYAVLKVAGDFSISVYGKKITIPKPLHEKRFCFIIDICQDYGGSFFLMLPPGSRDVLEMIDFIKMLRDSKGIHILPRGIGVSLQKNINVHHLETSLQLWNGDSMFTYPIFPRANLWIGGDAYMDVGVLKLQAESDIFLSIPAPNEILHSVFFEQWDAYLRLRSSAGLQIKFKISHQEHIINIRQLGAASIEAYASLGGVTTDRHMCGQTANPPGLFLSLVVDVNPFRGIPILEQFVLDINTKLYAFFTTDPASTVSETNNIDILQDVLQIDQLLQAFQNVTIRTVEAYSVLLSNESLVLLRDLNTSVTAVIKFVESELRNIQHFNLDHFIKSLSSLWTDRWDKLTSNVERFVDSIEHNNRVAKYNLADLVVSESNTIKEHLHESIKILTKQVLDILKNYEGFGLRFTGVLKLYKYKFELKFEIVHSVDSLGMCSKFRRVYEILKHESAIRVLGVAIGPLQLGRFLLMDVGKGLGMACSIETPTRCIVQLHTEAKLLGLKVDTDVFLDEKGLQFYAEGNLWNIYKAQIDVFAEHSGDWEDLLYIVHGQFLANTGKDNSFDDSYLDGVRKRISDLGNDANKRLSQVQAGLKTAQSGLTAAQHWITEKEDDVRSANTAFDEAIKAIEGAKHALEAAKGPFRSAIQKLNSAQRNVDNLCRIRSCTKLCIPGVKCRICWKKIWFARIPYPCCHFTSCMFKVPNLVCEAANLACRAIRGVAYVTLEAAKIFVRIPMLAMDAAKAALSGAQFVVDKSRVVLDIAVGAMELAKVGLDGAKGVLEEAKLAIEDVKVVVRIGLKIYDNIIKYGLQSLIDVRNCGFDIKLSTKDLNVFEVSCDVNAFKSGWKTVKFMINFNDPIQTLWQAAKSTVKMLAGPLGRILSGKRKRDVEFYGLIQTYRVIRALHDNETEDDYLDSFVNETIELTHMTVGFKNVSETIDDADIRINIFKEKCSVFTNVYTFISEANDVLLDIASETVTMLNNSSSVQDTLDTFNISDLQTNSGREDFGIDAEVAMKEYNLTRENITSVLDNVKEGFANASLLKGISDLAESAKTHMKSQVKEIENIKVTDHWMIAMENITTEFFKKDLCVSFLDCAHFAISELYDLYYAQNLPNTTEGLTAISTIEDMFLDLTGNRSHGIRMIHNLTHQIDIQLKRLDELAMFCSEAPKFLSPLTNQTVKNTTTVTLYCNATANPDPTFWWFQDGELIQDQNGIVLTINSSDTINSTQYQCMVGNIVANRSSDVAHVFIEEDEDSSVNEPEGTTGHHGNPKTDHSEQMEKVDLTGNPTKDVVIVTSVLGVTVGFVIVGLLVWRAVFRRRFRKAKYVGSLASLNMVRPASSSCRADVVSVSHFNKSFLQTLKE